MKKAFSLSFFFVYTISEAQSQTTIEVILFSSHHWELQFNFNNNRASSIIFLLSFLLLVRKGK